MPIIIPLIKDLEIKIIFKDKAKEERVSVINLVLLVLQLLKKDF